MARGKASHLLQKVFTRRKHGSVVNREINSRLFVESLEANEQIVQHRMPAMFIQLCLIYMWGIYIIREGVGQKLTDLLAFSSDCISLRNVLYNLKQDINNF